MFPFLLDRAVAFSETATFTKYIKRTSDAPRNRVRPPAEEIRRMRRDFSLWCGGEIDRRYGRRPLMRITLRIALWFYTNKRVYRLRTLLRLSLAERFGRKRP
jgi:hypothetical protein